MPSNAKLGAGLPLREPKLYDVLQSLKTSILTNLHKVKIGQIQSFDPTTFSATVQVVFQRVMNDGIIKNYPLLTKCPVLTFQGGGAALELPIAAGDQCLVLFADRNIDAWFQNGGVQPPPDSRMHDLSDAIAIVGLNYAGSGAIPQLSSSEARLMWKGAKVGINSSGLVTIQNQAQNLATILSTLLSAMASASTVAQIATAAGTAQTALALLLY